MANYLDENFLNSIINGMQFTATRASHMEWLKKHLKEAYLDGQTSVENMIDDDKWFAGFQAGIQQFAKESRAIMDRYFDSKKAELEKELQAIQS
jgi:hypothetical protein